jgi:uncharacterized protein
MRQGKDEKSHNNSWRLSRRALLAGAAGLSIGSSVTAQTGMVPLRSLGKTGIQVSALGIGGYHLGSTKTQEEANAIVREALDAGVNFFDNC